MKEFLRAALCSLMAIGISGCGVVCLAFLGTDLTVAGLCALGVVVFSLLTLILMTPKELRTDENFPTFRKAWRNSLRKAKELPFKNWVVSISLLSMFASLANPIVPNWIGIMGFMAMSVLFLLWMRRGPWTPVKKSFIGTGIVTVLGAGWAFRPMFLAFERLAYRPSWGLLEKVIETKAFILLAMVHFLFSTAFFSAESIRRKNDIYDLERRHRKEVESMERIYAKQSKDLENERSKLWISPN